MEKNPSFDRVVGDISELEKEQALDKKRKEFKESIEDIEKEKTPEELEMITVINKAVDEIRKKYGLKSRDISPENIHIIPEEKWPEQGKHIYAIFRKLEQVIIIREEPARIVFMSDLFHEMIHFKSYNALQVTTGEDSRLAPYRCGLTVNTRDGKKKYFNNLNEAVTEEMKKKFLRKLIDDYPSFFTEEIKQTREIIRSFIEDSSRFSDPIFENTYYAKIIGKTETGEYRLKSRSLSYGKERKFFNTLIDKITERNQGKFKDREEVFEIFEKATITGNILPMARLIEETFNEKGLFRKIGELDDKIEEQEKLIDSL